MRATLPPLLFVELALLAIYTVSHDWSRAGNIAAMQNLANQELSRLVENQAEAIEHQLAGVTQLTELPRQENDPSSAAVVDFSEPYLVASKTLTSTGWRLVVFAPQNEIFKPATELSEHLIQIGWYLMGA